MFFQIFRCVYKNYKDYKKYINLFRKAFEKNIALKLGEEARPFEVAKFNPI